ncbi:MAG: energy transducer TonB [Pseudomonadota bacterium]
MVQGRIEPTPAEQLKELRKARDRYAALAERLHDGADPGLDPEEALAKERDARRILHAYEKSIANSEVRMSSMGRTHRFARRSLSLRIWLTIFLVLSAVEGGMLLAYFRPAFFPTIFQTVFPQRGAGKSRRATPIPVPVAALANPIAPPQTAAPIVQPDTPPPKAAPAARPEPPPPVAATPKPVAPPAAAPKPIAPPAAAPKPVAQTPPPPAAAPRSIAPPPPPAAAPQPVAQTPPPVAAPQPIVQPQTPPPVTATPAAPTPPPIATVAAPPVPPQPALPAPALSSRPAVAAALAPIRLEPIAGTHSLPPYPDTAKRLGEAGATRIRITVSAEGTVAACHVVASSGSERLDAVACSHVQDHWRWKPPLRDGQPATAETNITVVWNLRNAR